MSTTIQTVDASHVPGEVIAEARLERAVFVAFLQQGTERLQLGELRVHAKDLFARDASANGHNADVGDVIDKLINVRCLDFERRGDFLTLTERGQARVAHLRAALHRG
jgi:hypothetical protein